MAAILGSLMILGAGAGLAVESIQAISVRGTAAIAVHPAGAGGGDGREGVPFAPRRKVARETSSMAMEADAMHHRTDAITSAAALMGITVALIGGKDTRRRTIGRRSSRARSSATTAC